MTEKTSKSKPLAIYPCGMAETNIFKGLYYGTKIKVYPHGCYFESYRIDDKYYWFYDEEMIYHIEDSETKRVVFVCVANNPQVAIDEFLKHKEVLK